MVKEKKEEKVEKEKKEEKQVTPKEESAEQKSKLEADTDTKSKKDKEDKKVEDKPEKEEKPTEEPKEEKKEEKPKQEKKKEKEDRIGILNIYTTFNNTVMNLTDLSGNCIAKYSGGQSTKQDRLKANPTIAMFISQRIAEEARDNGITGFYVKIRAQTGQANPGPGAHAAIKSLTRAGFRILSIMDTTRIARGGPKKKGGRRGRRV